MNRVVALSEARRLAREGHVAFTEHARKRDPKNGKHPLSREQVVECILRGSIDGMPTQEIRGDGWRFTIERLHGVERHAAAVVLKKNVVVIVVTAYATAGRRR